MALQVQFGILTMVFNFGGCPDGQSLKKVSLR